MQVRIVVASLRKPHWVADAVEGYRQRFRKPHSVEVIELSRQTKASEENAALCAKITEGSYVVALDQRGQSLSSEKLASKFSAWSDAGQSLTFIIGGADGLSDDTLSKAHWCWSLSAMTLPHGLAAVFCLEQLYRAWTVTVNHPYHLGH